MDDRFMRQQLLIPEAMKQATVVLVGLGMLGSWTAHALARSCGAVIGYDFDAVGRENIGTQAYDTVSIGFPKARELENRHLLGLPFFSEPTRFHAETEVQRGVSSPLVVVSAVDSFEGRRMVAEWAEAHDTDLFIDTRAHGTVGVVVAVPIGPHGQNAIGYYLESLEADDTAPAPQCGAEGTAFVGMWVASQVASTIVRHFRGLPYAYKVVQDVGMGITLMSIPVQEVTPIESS